MFGRVFILHRLADGFPNHFESHSRWSGYRIESGPTRLIDHRDVLHFQREGVAIGTDRQAMLRNSNDPVESRRRNRRMKIVDLVCGNRRSPEQGQSYMGEGALLCCPGGPIFSLHHAVIGCGAAKCDAISLIVGAHARKCAAPGNLTFEMVDMRGL